LRRGRKILVLIGGGAPVPQSEAERQLQEAERRYADVLKAHDETGAPLPAPNGQPSKLNRRQWLQVRTPAFKEWFGDWEAAEVKRRILQTSETETTTNGLAADKSASYKDLREEAILTYRGPNKTTNLETGNQIFILKSGLQDALQHGMQIQKRAVVAILDKLIERATFVARDTENMKQGVRAIETYAARALIDGQSFIVRLVVREVQDGRRFYDHELSEIGSEKRAGYSEGSSESFPARQLEPRPSARPKKSIADRILTVNVGDISQALDPNGEPLIVEQDGRRVFQNTVTGETRAADPAEAGAPDGKVGPWQMTVEEAKKELSELQARFSGPQGPAGEKYTPEARAALQPRIDALKERLGWHYWQRTQEQVRRVVGMPAEKHRQIVKKALLNGKPVPPEVLADYPDLLSGALDSATIPAADTFRLIAEGARLFAGLDEDATGFFADLGRLREILVALGEGAEAQAPESLDHQQAPDEETLQEIGLLYEFNGRWKYSTSGSWFTANSKEDAVSMATETYWGLNPEERLTRAQRVEKAEQDELAESRAKWGHLSPAQLSAMDDRMSRDLAALQKAGRREFNGNGGRRTASAVSAQGARDVAEEQRKLRRYIESQAATAPTHEPHEPAPEDDESDDPNSPNYRYRDTGVIDGARKMTVTESFRAAVRQGQLIRWQSIDWDEVEANPRRAKELITKSNLFGKVDWNALRESGADPGAAFLIDRVYAAIGKEPPEDSPWSRQDYARGIESVRERLETCRTPDEVKQALDEMREEWRGVMLSPSESDAYQTARADYDRLRAAYKALEDENKALADVAFALKQQLDGLKSDQYRYGRKRKGQRDPEIDAKIAALEPLVEAAYQKLRDFRDANNMATKSRLTPSGGTTYLNDHEWEMRQAIYRAEAIKQSAMKRNLIENPVTRSWIALGERFHAILTGKSEAFAGHRANVRAGKVNDWSWAEKDAPSAPKTTKRAAQFQLQVADKIERIGGSSVEVRSTHELKDRFGLRDVQSGNWVLKDPESAQWHVQQAAGALMDLSELLGVDPKTVAMNGRLALAFGARGTGNAGFGGAARAHYEPVERVINITKMKGGGTLAHEWFHSLDNLIGEAHGAGALGYASEDPALRMQLPPAVGNAWELLHDVMLSGPHRATRTLAITDRDRSLAKSNLEYPRPGLPVEIKMAGSLEAAVDVVDRAERANAARLEKYGSRRPTKKDVQRYEDWRRVAVAYYAPEDQSEVSIPYGPPMSAFALEAQKIDGERKSPYWGQPREMAARAFQAWVEDRLSGSGRRNDYLSAKADNKHYIDPIFGPIKPFPEGEERERINRAFDELVEAMRAHGTIKATMDAVFGADDEDAPWWASVEVMED
jgi:hypothetical protein